MKTVVIIVSLISVVVGGVSTSNITRGGFSIPVFIGSFFGVFLTLMLPVLIFFGIKKLLKK